MNPAWRARLADPMFAAICALGVAQITVWGTTYYCLGVLAASITADTGWSRSLVFFGFTIALLAMGAVSVWAGRLIDRHGARPLMLAGTLLVSLGLFALSLVRSEAAYLAVWAFLGVGMRLTLYDASFAALVQAAPTRGRMAISYLTLFGAFASTVFWVIGHYLNQALGWRQTLAAFAVIQLLVCLPLNAYGLSWRESGNHTATPAEQARAVDDRPPLAGRARTLALVLFALVMSLNGFIFGVVSVQLVPLLQAAGLTAAAAVWVASLKGFAQFGGRVVEIFFGSKLRAITVGRIAIGVLPLSIIVLLLAGGNLTAIVTFTLVMGAAQGVITIVRGAVPLALFGREGYGAVLGLIATPVVVVNATAPTLFALIVDRWGWQAAELALLATSAASWFAMELMSRWYERQHTVQTESGGD
jgi:predicted MFS family arabinose efflux permease